MLFLGDLACPDQKIEEFIDCVNKLSVFDDEIIVLNLEANIVDKAEERKSISLYNLSRITNAFSQSKKIIVSLANNHMYDYPDKILETCSILQNHGIGVFGLYEKDEIKPLEYTNTDGQKYAFFGHCWRLYTNTNQNTKNNVRVVDCPYDCFLDIVKKYTNKHPEVKTYCFMHWNYDLEKYPFPLHRTLSQKLIDIGVEGVIGSHSHRPQGFEVYKGKLIAYCLGNFYLPSGIYFNGKLKYPSVSKKTYGIRVNGKSYDRIWFDTDRDDKPLALNRIDKDIINQHSYDDYIDMDRDDYLKFFKRYREKRFLVPVFTDLGGTKVKYQEAWAITRVKILRTLKGLLKK